MICPWRMRKLLLLCAVAPCAAMLIVGCKKKDDGAADAADDAPAPVAVVDAAPAVPAAKNNADIARFPAAEKALADDDQKILDPFTQARTGPKQGAVVANLKAGTDPFKIAEFQDSILVQFPDPKDANTQLMGWIPKAAFTKITVFDAGIKDAAVVDAAAIVVGGLLKCPAGQEAIVNIGTAALCRKKCTVNTDCKTPSVNACVAASTNQGKIAKVCANESP